MLRQALSAHESIGLVVFHSLMVVHLGEVCVLADQLEEAVAVARRALTLTRERGERGHEAYALRLCGEIAAYPDPPDVEAAAGHYHQAMALATEFGMRPLVAHCHHGLGRLSSRTGEHAKAEQHLATAAAMYREMDMGYWLEKAETAATSAR